MIILGYVFLAILCLLPVFVPAIFVAICYKRGWITWDEAEYTMKAVKWEVSK